MWVGWESERGPCAINETGPFISANSRTSQTLKRAFCLRFDSESPHS
jgi:hypothetical protein